jgi:peptide/nickel transport system permease protein
MMPPAAPPPGPGQPRPPGAEAATAGVPGSPHRAAAGRRFLRRPAGAAAVAWLVLVTGGAVFAPLAAPYDPQAQDLSHSLSGPSPQHLLGTDQLGRDVLSQLLFGARPALIGVASAVAVWLVLGVSLGVIAGYARGRADTSISRAAELLLSLPALVILLVVFSVFPNSLVIPMAVLGLVASAGIIRIIRSVTLTVREDLYVRAARAFGLSHARIVARHILPRIAGTVVVQASLFASLALVIETGLAFLGFGVVLPKPSWGGLISEASELALRSPWLLVPSGGIICLTVLALVLFGNAVRDTWTESWSPSQLSTGHPGTAAANEQAASTGGPSVSCPPDVLLAVDRLSVEFTGPGGPRPVVSDVSFSVRKGETLAVVGETGCGKTVMALAVLGLLPAGGRRTAGRVLLGGHDLATSSSRELAAVRGRRVGYIAQDPMVSLDPTFTVGAQIAEAVRCHAGLGRSAARRRAVELLESVNLPQPATVARRYPHQLSGGMLQRCVIALALSGDPDLLIADEPTTALDVTVQAEILTLLRSLQTGRQMAVMLITHDWEVVAGTADRALVMYAGEVAEDANVADLLTGPAHPYARALLGSDPVRAVPGQRLPVIPGSVPVPGAWPAGCRFAPRCPEAGPECQAGPVELTVTAREHLTRCLHAEPAARGRS